MNTYLIARCVHVNCVMLWMIGMFTVPWFFVIHKKYAQDAVIATRMAKWENYVLRVLIAPALILTFLSGCYLVDRLGGWTLFSMRWFQIKVFFLLIMFPLHAMFSRFRKAFIRNKPTQTEETYIRSAIFVLLLMVAINVTVMMKV